MTKLESTVRTRELGRRLRWVQENAGLSGVELAARLGWTTTAVSRTLSGLRDTPDVDVAAFLAVCGVTGAERDGVLRLCRSDDGSGVLRLPGDEQWPAFLAHAAAALRLTEFQPYMVPWPVQTPDYGHAHLADADFAARRAALDLLRLPQITLFLHEWALRTGVGGAAVMSEQLHHLLRMSVRPELSIRVVPASHGVPTYPFTLLEFDTHSPVVYREDHTGGAIIDHRAEIAGCRTVVAGLAAVALDEQRSRDLIGTIATGTYGDALLLEA